MDHVFLAQQPRKIVSDVFKAVNKFYAQVVLKDITLKTL